MAHHQYRRHPPAFTAALHHPHPSVAAAAAAAFHAGQTHPHVVTAAEVRSQRRRARHHVTLIAEHSVGADQHAAHTHPPTRARHAHAPRAPCRRGGGGGGVGRHPPAAFGVSMPQACPFAALLAPAAPGAEGPPPGFAPFPSPLPDTPHAALVAAAKELAALQAYTYTLVTQLRGVGVVDVPSTPRGALHALARAAAAAARAKNAATGVSREAREVETPVEEGGLMEVSVGSGGG